MADPVCFPIGSWDALGGHDVDPAREPSVAAAGRAEERCPQGALSHSQAPAWTPIPCLGSSDS